MTGISISATASLLEDPTVVQTVQLMLRGRSTTGETVFAFRNDTTTIANIPVEISDGTPEITAKVQIVADNLAHMNAVGTALYLHSFTGAVSGPGDIPATLRVENYASNPDGLTLEYSINGSPDHLNQWLSPTETYADTLVTLQSVADAAVQTQDLVGLVIVGTGTL